MIRRPTLALLLALIPGIAVAQFAAIAPTPPTADNGDRIATTAWARNFLSGGLPLPSGQIFVGSVGGIAVAQTPSGDLTVSTGGAFTLATVNGNTGAFGSATQCVTVTNNAKGLTTAVSAATCAPAIGSVTGWGTGVLAAMQIAVGSAGAPVLFNGAGGTPSAIVLTNGTGTAAGLTAGTVTTNANLTGAVTSVGNAASLGSFTSAQLAGALTNETGTGAAVFGTSPAITTPTGIVKGDVGLGNVANVDTTNAANISSGTLLAARMPALTGDCTTSAGAVATSCTKINGVDQTAAWSTYTPTPTCNTGAGTWTTNTAKSKQLGKTVFWEIDVTLSAVGTCTGIAWKFNLPSTAVSGAGGAGGETAVNGSYVICANSAASAVVTCTTNTPLAVNERFVASGVYEGP